MLVFDVNPPEHVLERLPLADDFACGTVPKEDLAVPLPPFAFFLETEHRFTLPAEGFPGVEGAF